MSSSHHRVASDPPEIVLTVLLGAALVGLVVWITILQEEHGTDHVRAGTTAGQDMAPAGATMEATAPR